MDTTTKQQNTQTRPPIVVVLGHVDHGKSSLLEAIREDFDITSKESGGITQHIGAYQAEYQGKSLTFIDTPGHAAFAAMRSRGTKVADVAVVVVAADESVKPQTIEVLQQVKELNMPLVVVLNKIDRPEANVEKVKMDLSQHDVFVESYGGKVPSVETSAETKQGIPELLEMILLVAELEDLAADYAKPGTGVVIESYIDAQRGATATLLVTDGTVRKGDIVGTKSAVGKMRVLEDTQGNEIEEAGPATPVVVLGLESRAHVGEVFQVFEDEKAARDQIEEQVLQNGIAASAETGATLNIILKTDVVGSLEAIEEMLSQLPQGKVALSVVRADVGDIGESDVKLAQGTEARILGFHVSEAAGIRELAERSNVRIESFGIIYELVDRVQALMAQNVQEELVRTDWGTMEVLAVFLSD
ncbi:MAG: translation initiation factor IF-2, partial [archaeon]|nr:translation initiation factor IF-2 [archaeon]